MGVEFIEDGLESVVADFARYDKFSIDLETSGLNPLDSRILLCQIGFGDKEYVINALKVDLSPLLPFLASHDWLKIVFNDKFEDKCFRYFYNTPIKNIFDCYLAERILNPDRKSGNSFEDLAQFYLNVNLDKKVRQSFISKKTGPFTEKQIKYAAEDVQYLFPLYEAQKKLIVDKDLEKIADLEFQLATVVASMELEGIGIDVPKWRDKIRDYEKQWEESRLRMLDIVFDQNGVMDEQLGMFERAGAIKTKANVRGSGTSVNLKSQPQVLETLQKLGIDVEGTSERELEKVDHPAAKELLTYRKLQKIVSSYGFNILEKIHPFDGRLHADFRQLGTETGRFSCKEPNLQQMPEEFRECFIAGEDRLLVGGDYSQIELRILAEASGDTRLIEAFKSGVDLHTSTAAIMFNLPLDRVSKEQRFAAKTLNFGMMYGMGIEKLMDSLNVEAAKNGKRLIDIRESQTIHNKYKKTYKRATDWLEQIGLRAVREGTAHTLYGRKRFFNRPATNVDPKLYKKQIAGIQRQGANTPIQGTSADITKLAMLNLHNDLEDYGYKGKIVLTVHDEIVVLAHKKQSEAIKTMLVESMTRSAQQILKRVPVQVDAFVSEIWHKGG